MTPAALERLMSKSSSGALAVVLALFCSSASAIAPCVQMAVSSLLNVDCSIGSLEFRFGSAISIRDDFHLTSTRLSDLTFTPLTGATGFTITGPLVTPSATGKTVEIELDMGGFNSFWISTLDGSAKIAGVTAIKDASVIGTGTSFAEFNVIDANPAANQGHGVGNIAYAQPGLGSNSQAKSVTLGMSVQSASKVYVNLIALGGLTSGPGNVIGFPNTITSVSSTFIVNLGDRPLPSGVGNSSMNPILPAQVITTSDGNSMQFSFPVAQNDPLVFDPPVAVGYTFDVRSGPSFRSVLVPAIGNSHYVLHFFDGSPDVALAANTTYTFTQGIGRFQVLGIDPAANLDPSSNTAFQVKLAFVTGGNADFTMTPVTAVPEPPIHVLYAIGLCGIGVLRRVRKTVSRS